MTSEHDPELAAKALEGLAKYESAPRAEPRPPKPVIAQQGPAKLRDYGGMGRPLMLIPSLINPPSILDLDEEVSLADALSRTGRRVMLLDWGKAEERRSMSVGDHVEAMLVSLVGDFDMPPALVGCG